MTDTEQELTTPDSTMEKICELMDSHALTLKDVTALIAQATAHKVKGSKKVVIEPQYKGVAYYSCITCNNTFDNDFTCNKPNKVLTYRVETCTECKYRLLDCSKEELIEIILHRKIV